MTFLPSHPFPQKSSFPLSPFPTPDAREFEILSGDNDTLRLPHPFSLERSLSQRFGLDQAPEASQRVVPSLPPSLSSEPGVFFLSLVSPFHTLTPADPSQPSGPALENDSAGVHLLHAYMHTHSQKYGEELRCHAQSLLFNGKQNKLQIIMTGKKSQKAEKEKELSEKYKAVPWTVSVLKKEKETRLFIICFGLV